MKGQITKCKYLKIFLRIDLTTFKKGTKEGKGFTFKAYEITIPPRPFMVIREPEIDEIIGAVEKHIMN